MSVAPMPGLILGKIIDHPSVNEAMNGPNEIYGRPPLVLEVIESELYAPGDILIYPNGYDPACVFDDESRQRRIIAYSASAVGVILADSGGTDGS